MSKKSLSPILATAAVVALSATLAPVATAQSSMSSLFSGSSSGSLSSSGNNGGGGNGHAQEVSPGIDTTLIGDLLGPELSEEIGLLVGDLGVMAQFGEGEEFAIIFGDSWRGNKLGNGDWIRIPGVVGVKQNGRIKILRPLNEGDIAQELVDIPEDGILTVIPSDIINFDGTLYMQGMRVRGIGNVLQTHIWRSTDNGQNWDRIGTAKPGFNSGMTNLISWAEGPDGYIYQASTQFQRKDDVYLQRFKPEDIANYGKWEYFQPDTGQWTGKIGKPILSTDVRAGELNLRYIEGHWVLAMFNEQRMAIEVRISREIDTDWNAIKPADVVVSGPWNQTQDENNFSQLYGAYIVPGSTLGHMDLVVSQWKTSDDSRYNSTQFNVKGLDKFFGVTPQTNTMLRMAPQMDESARGNQDVIEVSEAPNTELQQHSAAAQGESVENLPEDITVVPLR
nr:DUF4185 domain-containing protein [Corynebacterium casei]